MDRGESGVAKGMFIDKDDQIRKVVIERLMCNQRFSYAEAEALCGKSFAEYFATQWAELDSFEADGLIERQEDALVVTSIGRHFLRNLCMLFDRHLADMQKEGRFSRTV
jgi:oxygen-independent coproporphyrinogen-3 oxidase